MSSDFEYSHDFDPFSLDDPIFSPSHYQTEFGDSMAALRPINWNMLTADEAQVEWLVLDRWVKEYLRDEYCLPPAIVPPFWHRHRELLWELSALHQLHVTCYSADADPTAPSAFHRDFADAKNRLWEWVALSGTRLDRDRPTRRTAWPGEDPIEPAVELVIENRDRDFYNVVAHDLERRREIGHAEGGRR